jgi:hydroxyacid-oxoacid transhydrogenase
VIDADNTRELPPQVAACTGLDVLSHAVESWTALPFHRRPAPEHPGLRPAYQGSNPISNVWAARAIELVARYLVRAIEDPSDDEARGQMLLADVSPGSASATPGSTYLTACRIPSRGWSGISSPPATRSAGR